MYVVSYLILGNTISLSLSSVCVCVRVRAYVFGYVLGVFKYKILSISDLVQRCPVISYMNIHIVHPQQFTLCRYVILVFKITMVLQPTVVSPKFGAD